MLQRRPQLEAAPDLRIVQIDVLRGVAVLGIYWINVIIFAFPHGVYAWPNLLGNADTANILAWAHADLLVEGTMRGIFSMLFGASALIFLDEAKLQAKGGLQVVDLYYRRNLLLIAFGIIHAFVLLAQWDLLYAYGLFALFLFPIRNFKPKTLLILGVMLLALGDLHTLRTNLEGEAESIAARSLTGQAAAERTAQLEQSTVEAWQAEADIYLSGYFDIFAYEIPLVAAQQSTEMYNDHVYDMGGMMLIGMALFKLGVLNGAQSLRTLLLLSVAGYTFGCLLRTIEIFQVWASGFDAEKRDPWTVMPYNIARLGVALGHIGLFCALMKAQWFLPVAKRLAPVGRMAFTNYVAQTVISVFFFYGFGLGYYAYFERYQLIWVCLAVWAVQIIASNWWLSHYRIGPLEWVWRSLTYGQRQPLSRAIATVEPDQAIAGSGRRINRSPGRKTGSGR